MTEPTAAVFRILWALTVGAFLGICYDFLRPLRRRRHAPADILFFLVSLYAWIWYSFKICGGDIRLGGTVALGLGMLLWLGTASVAVRKLFYWLWLVIFRIWFAFSYPFTKIFKIIGLFVKKVFAYGKKRGYNREYDEKPTDTRRIQYE